MLFIIDIIHYLIGLIIVGFLVWGLIQIHNHFSKDNTTMYIESLTNITPLTNNTLTK